MVGLREEKEFYLNCVTCIFRIMVLTIEVKLSRSLSSEACPPTCAQTLLHALSWGAGLPGLCEGSEGCIPSCSGELAGKEAEQLMDGHLCPGRILESGSPYLAVHKCIEKGVLLFRFISVVDCGVLEYWHLHVSC